LIIGYFIILLKVVLTTDVDSSLAAFFLSATSGRLVTLEGGCGSIGFSFLVFFTRHGEV